MSATPALPEAELLELLIQLQKTTPDQARAILNAQPAIGYALVPLMVGMNIINLDVLQKTMTAYVAPAQIQAQPPPVAPSVPAHVAQAHYQQPTPPPVAPTPTPAPAYPAYQQNGAAQPGYPPQYAQQTAYSQAASVPPQIPPYGMPIQEPAAAAPPSNATAILGALGNIPDDQKEMIMRVIVMTPEQINQLPPQDRAITIQLRATLGLPS